MKHIILWATGSVVTRMVAAVAMAVALVLPMAGLASAANPSGGSVTEAMPLTGTVTGSLAPGQTIWYSYWHDAKLNDALTLKSNPTVDMTTRTTGDYGTGVFFNVEWRGISTDTTFPGGMFEEDLPGYYRVGQSTQALLKDGNALPAGTQYWQQGKSTYSLPFVVAVVNASTSPVNFALTLDQTNNAVSADDNAIPAPAAAPTVAAPTSPVVSAAPVAQPAPSLPSGGGVSEAIPLTGTMTGSLAPGQTIWYSYWHDAKLNDALTLKSNPTVDMTTRTAGDYGTGVFFNVEWRGISTDTTFPGGMFEKDLPGYYRVGQSTQALLKDGTVLPDGTQYWQQGKSTYSLPFVVAVVNASTSPISYALTLDQTNAPVSADDNAIPAAMP